MNSFQSSDGELRGKYLPGFYIIAVVKIGQYGKHFR